MTTFQCIQHACFIFMVFEFLIGFIISGVRIYRVYKKPVKRKKDTDYSWVDKASARLLDREEELEKKRWSIR